MVTDKYAARAQHPFASYSSPKQSEHPFVPQNDALNASLAITKKRPELKLIAGRMLEGQLPSGASSRFNLGRTLGRQIAP
jgi:hypothetical protein